MNMHIANQSELHANCQNHNNEMLRKTTHEHDFENMLIHAFEKKAQTRGFSRSISIFLSFVMSFPYFVY